jgi:hypothetical protein
MPMILEADYRYSMHTTEYRTTDRNDSSRHRKQMAHKGNNRQIPNVNVRDATGNVD